MIKLLRFLWSGCFHDWEIIKVAEYRDYAAMFRGHCEKFTLRCTKCGAMKSFTSK